RRESFGLAALEARLAGVPVLAHAASGVADFVDDGTGGLLGRNPAELSHALVRLVTDHDLRHALASHNRRFDVEECTWPAVLGAFEEIYSSLTGLAEPEPPVAEPVAEAGPQRPGLYLVSDQDVQDQDVRDQTPRTERAHL
ncbi:glycosyltransferase, partial [Actinocorallia lasiicapitis]